MRSVQIPYELFLDIVKYFCSVEPSEASEPIVTALEAKLDSLIARDIFSRYKKAVSPSERELYRKQYLQQVGILPDFQSDHEKNGDQL